MKTIGYVVAEFPMFCKTFIGSEIRAMQARGHHVMTFALSPARGPVQPADLPLAESTCYLSEVGAPKLLGNIPHMLTRCMSVLPFVLAQQGLSPARLMLQAARLVEWVRRHGIGHLHAHFADEATSVAIVAARLANIGVSFTGHGTDLYAKAIDLPLKLKSADFAVATCAQSRFDLQRLEPEAVVIESHCGVDLKRFVFRPCAAERNGKFLFVGHFSEKKGVDVLLAALTAWPETKIDLVGDGPLLTEMKALAQRMELYDRVTFRGPQASEWLIEHAHEYVALVAPYRVAMDGDRHTSALVVKEAMALGLPVITTDLMGCSEVLDEVSGWKVKPDDIDALCDAMQDCLRMSTGQRMHMIYAARSRLESLYDIKQCVATLSRAIETLPRSAQQRPARMSGQTFGVDG